MENNCFFGTVLRSLGYEVVSVGARVHESINESRRDAYMGFSHMVKLIRLENVATYMVDVGFGGDGRFSLCLWIQRMLRKGLGSSRCG